MSDPHHSPDQQDRLLDERVRRAFEPPTLSGLVERVAAQARADAAARRGPARGALWAMAAALLLAVLGAGAFFALRESAASAGAELAQRWVASYVALEEREPTCCDDMGELAAECRKWCNAEIGLAQGAPVTILGSLTGPASASAGCLPFAVECNGSRACIFVVPKHQDPRVVLPEKSDLFLHRRELGELAVYELSRTREPLALAHFTVP
ncbi:MAG: hypothetical protein JNJ88_18285 [Planctomycetes bacterium]|nr:hypothetical protein [Planctomycetota bacterium]